MGHSVPNKDIVCIVLARRHRLLPQLYVSQERIEPGRSSRYFMESFAYSVDGVCFFRELEKGYKGCSVEVGCRELLNNLDWVYGDVPYLFRYVAVDTELRLYAIERPTFDQLKATTTEIGVFELDNLSGRLKLLLALLNITLLAEATALPCPDNGRYEYGHFERPNGIAIAL